jgi:TPR repeat protein
MSGARAGIWISAALLLSAYLLPSVVNADYQMGLEAYKRGDYERALNEWLNVANSPPETVHPGILSETFYALGMMYWIGQGVEQNASTAANWLRHAAELNHAGAQAKLGFLYSSGQGVAQSDFEALKWLTMAAEQGDVDAQYNLGVLYRDGKGVQQDTEKALRWFRAAAANGDAAAKAVLADYELAGPAGADDPKVESDEERVDAIAADHREQAAPASDSVLGQEWIRQQDPEHFTIQVIALLDSKRLYDFVERHRDYGPLAIYEQTWQGKPLWVLVQGNYEDVNLAREAVRIFPEDLQERDNLWIRRFAMVQRLLK